MVSSKKADAENNPGSTGMVSLLDVLNKNATTQRKENIFSFVLQLCPEDPVGLGVP